MKVSNIELEQVLTKSPLASETNAPELSSLSSQIISEARKIRNSKLDEAEVKYFIITIKQNLTKNQL